MTSNASPCCSTGRGFGAVMNINNDTRQHQREVLAPFADSCLLLHNSTTTILFQMMYLSIGDSTGVRTLGNFQITELVGKQLKTFFLELAFQKRVPLRTFHEVLYPRHGGKDYSDGNRRNPESNSPSPFYKTGTHFGSHAYMKHMQYV